VISVSEKHFFCIPARGKLTVLDSLEDAMASLDCGYVWLDFHEPGKEALMELVEALGVHPLSVEDCLDEDQIPKIEDFPTNTFVLFNSYAYENRELVIKELDLIVGRKFLLTVNHDMGAQEALFERVRMAVDSNADTIRSGPDFLLHLILDHTVDRKFAAIEAVQDAIDSSEERILKDPSHFQPEELMMLRRQLLTLRKSLVHEREILMKICRGDSSFIGEKAIYHFRDVYDHLAKFFEAIEIYREMIGSLMEMYLSIINFRMTMVASRTNRVMRRLTFITTIFMPLTLLAGVGGMSEWTMMTGASNWRISYSLFLLLMAVIAAFIYGILKWNDARDRTEVFEHGALSYAEEPRDA